MDEKPIRINKYIQRYTKISRRMADALISKNRVIIDDGIAKLGDIVHPGQKVYVDGKEIVPFVQEFIYIVLNKPCGFICSRKGKRTVFELLPEEYRHLSYIGRLDVATSGVLLFSDDGEMVYELSRSSVSRIYDVELDEPIEQAEILCIKRNFLLDGIPVRVGEISVKGKKVEMELFEGRWREVRRIFAKLGKKVIRLHRKSFAIITDNGLLPGKFRHLSEDEVCRLKNLL